MEGVTALQALLKWLILMASECVTSINFRKPLCSYCDLSQIGSGGREQFLKSPGFASQVERRGLGLIFLCSSALHSNSPGQSTAFTLFFMQNPICAEIEWLSLAFYFKCSPLS